MRALNPLCFMFNSLAMGDVIAATPVVKYMVDNYFQEEPYLVVAKEMFRPFFHFIPDSNFHNFEDKDNVWGIPSNFAIASLNQPKTKDLVRNTPKHMHLSQFASIKLADRILSNSDLYYVPLLDEDVSSFNVDFSRAVILVTSHRDATRAWKAEYVLEVGKYVEQQGYIPVFVGKTDMNQDTNLQPKTSLPQDLGFGVDLRNKTSISQLAAIMKRSVAVCGLDSGPIHLAGTTSVPIICGYTSVSAQHRIPLRPSGSTFTITPNIPCIGCESKWTSHFWNFENCYLRHIKCCEEMTPDKFIHYLNIIFRETPDTSFSLN